MRAGRAHRSATDKRGRLRGIKLPREVTTRRPHREHTAPINPAGWPLAWLVRLNQADKPVPYPLPFSPPHGPPSPVPLPPSSSAHPSPSAPFVFYCTYVSLCNGSIYNIQYEGWEGGRAGVNT